MKLSFRLCRNQIRSLQFLILLLTLINYSSKASSVVGCDDFVCIDLKYFKSIPFNLDLEVLTGEFCENLSFSPDELNHIKPILNEGFTPYTVYNLITGDSCSATVEMVCWVTCLDEAIEVIEFGKDSIYLQPTDFSMVSCYFDEVFLPPYDSGIFYEGEYEVIFYSTILDDSCTMQLSVVPACEAITCKGGEQKYYNSILWAQDILEEEGCLDTSAYWIELLDDQDEVLASGNSIVLVESLPNILKIKVTHIESGFSCDGALWLFHNCLDDAIDTLFLDFTGLESITITWDSLLTEMCEDSIGVGFTFYYPFTSTSPSIDAHGNESIMLPHTVQDGKIILIDWRVTSDVDEEGSLRKEVVLINTSLELIQGVVFSEEDGNCEPEDPIVNPAEGFLVYAAGLTDTLYDYSDSIGEFNFWLPENYSYDIGIIEFNNFWDVCINESPVILSDSSENVFIGLSIDTLCSYLKSDLSIPRLRRCFDNYVYINYCNQGSDTAYNVVLDIYFDDGLEIEPEDYGFTVVNANHFQFNIGTLAPLQCGSLTVTAFVDCDLDLGAEICVEVELGPIPSCNDSEEWSGAALDVQGICDGDSVRFSITNIGAADMIEPQEFIVIEDDIMIIQDVTNLPEGESIELAFLANGSTFRLMADQEPFHPYTQKVSALVKACAEGSTGISTGFANSFILDEQAPYISIECLPVVGAYDPNDKTVTPSGAYDNHIIVGNENLEYTIRFENTGTDTAFTVRVLDTLDANLDLFSFKLSNSSHPVEVEFPANGIVEFKFKNIELPDTSVNKLGAQGFVKYTIRPRQNLPLETKIYNSAGIIFDFNPAIITNKVDLQVGQYVFTGLKEQPKLRNDFISPNPANTDLNVHMNFDHFIIFDINGNRLLEGDYSTKIDIAALSSGLYIIQIFENEILMGIERFIKINQK